MKGVYKGFWGSVSSLPLVIALAQPQSNTWAKAYTPFFTTYCAKCHAGAGLPELRLDVLKDPSLALSKRDQMEKMVEFLKLEIMPPHGQKQPTKAERQAIIAAIQKLFASAPTPNDPGRVTMRRLNRAEYDNTIRDLLKIDFKPSADFPNDDVGYGFDNIGDVLSLSPLLFEKYLNAAEKAASMAIALPEIRTWRFDSGQMVTDLRNNELQDGSLTLYSQGFGAVDFDAPKAGPYTLKVTAWATQAGPEVAKMGIRVGQKDLQVFDVHATRAKPETYEVPLDLAKGASRISANFLNDYYNAQDPNPRTRDRNLYLVSIEITGPLNIVAEKPAFQKEFIQVQPEPKDPLPAARETLRPFLLRAFRRPPSDDIVERYAKLVQVALKEGETFEQGLRTAVTAALVSPQFLFRIELDPRGNSSKTRPLDDYELASRLSYFLWSSMPDRELFDLAAKSRLRDPAVLKGQALRMLKDPNAKALTDNFASQWLTLRKLENVSPDPELFPTFNDQLRADMEEETLDFFAEVVRADRSVIEFLDAPYTFLNERLAGHYGIAGISGSNLRKVTLKDPNRGGLLTMASVLTVTSNPNRTSPVKRGKWLLENILGAPPPPPPPGLDSLEGDKDKVPAKTIKERMARHRKDPTCAVCHAKMDPLGIAFENYNAVGKWRTMDGKFKVDPTGQTAEGEKFSNATDLKKILLGRKGAFVKTLTEKLMVFGLGRGLEQTDRKTVEQIAKQSEKEGYKFSSLVKGIVLSDAFRRKRMG